MICTNCNKEITSGRVICKECYTQLDEWKEKAKKYDELTKTPTLEEVKKEWQELGYEFITLKEEETLFYILNLEEMSVIKIDCKNKKYIKVSCIYYSDFIPTSFEEHQLLTKTFKALG